MSSGGDQVVDTVVSTVGLWWPDAEEGDLRAAAEAWERMAAALDAVAVDGRATAGRTLQGWAGEAATAFGEHWAAVERDGIVPSADGCRAMADGLRRYADEVENAKHEIEVLAVEVGATIALGVATAWFTFGSSAAIAAGVTARLVSLAASIGVRMSASVAGIVSSALSGAAFGAVDGAAANGLGQVYRVEALDEGGYSGGEIATSAATGAGGGAVLGGGFGALGTRALRDPAPSPELLRGPGGDIRAALTPSDWGPLRGRWAPGLTEDAQRLLPHERTTAQHLADQGTMVHSRAPRAAEGYKNPDLIVRTGPADPGTYTELKQVNATSAAVSRGIRKADRQLGSVGGGAVVLDGRASGLTAEVAREGWERAQRDIARSDQSGSTSARILLADGTELRLPER